MWTMLAVLLGSTLVITFLGVYAITRKIFPQMPRKQVCILAGIVSAGFTALFALL